MFTFIRVLKAISDEINQSLIDSLKDFPDLLGIATDVISPHVVPAVKAAISTSITKHPTLGKDDLELIGGSGRDHLRFPSSTNPKEEVLMGDDMDEISGAWPRFYEESFNRRRDANGNSYFEANVKSWQTDYITKTYYGRTSISANQSIYSKFKDVLPDPSKRETRQWVDVKAEWNDWGGVSTAHVQLPPGWAVAGEYQGYTVLMGPKGENLYVGEVYDNDFVQFTSKSIF